MVGPLREHPGYDPLMQAAGGIMSVTGEAGRPPARAGVSVVDQGTGMWAVIAVLSALRLRDQGAAAQLVDLSLFETAVNWLPYQLAGYLGSGVVPRAMGTALGIISPYQAFESADRWVMVAAGNDRQFASLCEALGSPELADDPRFRTNPDRVANRQALAELIAERFRTDTAASWLERLFAAGVPAAPVQDLAEVAGYEQTEAMELLQPAGAPDRVRSQARPSAADGERRTCPAPHGSARPRRALRRRPPRGGLRRGGDRAPPRERRHPHRSRGVTTAAGQPPVGPPALPRRSGEEIALGRHDELAG